MKTGLALSGGGALGIAHLGVLSNLENAQIGVDLVCGTSAGAIVGLLYSAGGVESVRRFFAELSAYSVISPRNIVKLRNPHGFFMQIERLLREITQVNDFNQLRVPFSCIATRVDNGQVTVMSKGDPVQCAMASAAYPGVFPMQKVGNHHYIDGAVSLNMPVSPLRQQGADYVIASSVYCLAGLSHEVEKLNAWQIAARALEIMENRINAYELQNADFVFTPPVMGYTWYQFSEFDHILEVTKPYTQQRVKELMAVHPQFIGCIPPPENTNNDIA